ncbi:hypothetical protein GCM10027299_21390 [Larkinella ripae]
MAKKKPAADPAEIIENLARPNPLILDSHREQFQSLNPEQQQQVMARIDERIEEQQEQGDFHGRLGYLTTMKEEYGKLIEQ